MERPFLKKMLLTALFAMPIIARAAGPVASKEEGSVNVLFISLITLIFVLLAVIGILGNVLRQVGFVYRDKIKADRSAMRSAKNLFLLIVLSIADLSVNAQEGAEALAPAPMLPSNYSGIPASEFYWLLGIIGLEMLVITALILSLRSIVTLLSKRPELKPAVEAIVRRSFWDRFHNVVAIEKEEDIMLDHNYDGIKELDNSLPPWWKYGFYATILVSIVYMYYYHMGGNGPSSYQEYMVEVEKGEEDKAAYLAKSAGNIDENNVKLLDAAGIAAGQVTFQNMCAACHAKDGGGGVGPNLTDEYWLHGGSLADVFKSIKYGWPDKGMKSWKDDFSPKQIAELTSYINSLKGSRPAAPKEKQGELYTEEANADSTQVAMVK